MKKILSISAMVLYSCLSHAQMSEAETKAMIDYATPGKMHEMMTKDMGTWTETTTIWMAPGAEPIKNTGSATFDMMFGGKYQVSRHTGNFMGMPFEGISTTGYDNSREVFINTWIDNMGTGIMYSEGKWNDATRSIDFKGNMTDPTVKKAIPFHQTLTFVDDKTRKIEMYTQYKGKEYKAMEILLTKQ